MAIILSLVQLALVISILQGAVGQSCDLSKYYLSLDALRLRKLVAILSIAVKPVFHFSGGAWYATIDDSFCIIDPKAGYNCALYFTVCDTLPEDVCNTTDSGMCMRIQNAANPLDVSERYELGKTTDQLYATRECSHIDMVQLCT